MSYLIIDGRHLLERCPYCGHQTVKPATSGAVMCEECSNKLKRYYALKYKLKRHPNNETSEQLATMIAEYRAAKSKGLKVPRDIVL